MSVAYHPFQRLLDVPISSLNVNISQFFDMGRKNGKNGKNKLKFA